MGKYRDEIERFIYEICYLQKKNYKVSIQLLDKDHYFVLKKQMLNNITYLFEDVVLN